MKLFHKKTIKKAVVVPDSFKGTLSASEVARAMCDAIQCSCPEAKIVRIPLADGGEGSVAAFLSACGGETVFTTVTGPYFEPVNAFYGMLSDGKTAVIEMAACAGLPLVKNAKDPSCTTTYGVGELMLHAVRHGAKKMILCLGGSATNDAGFGAAAAMGIRFLDDAGNPFIPVGGTLSRIGSIDISGLDPLIRSAEIIAMCDVVNPLYGPLGAAHVFAPQKGADPQMVSMLDSGLISAAKALKRVSGCDMDALPGGGAAGGMGAGMVALLSAKLKSGIETILEAVEFDKTISDADIIFTGEGKLDSQSLSGKAVFGVVEHAKRFSVPVIALVGGVEGDLSSYFEAGLHAVFPINLLPLPLSESAQNTAPNITFTMHNILRILLG